MRFIATADLHLGLKRFGTETPEGNSRVLDFGRTLATFADEAISNGCDFAAIVGDTFHTRHPGPRELAIFTEQVRRMADAYITVFVVPGNHDGMDTIGDPASHTLAWMRAARMENVYVLTEPGVHGYTNRQTERKVIIASVPYPHRRAYVPQGTPEERVEFISQKVEALIEQQGREAHGPRGSIAIPKVFLGHLSVANSKVGSEQSMRIGWDVTIRPEVLRDFDYAFLGHIHRAQRIADNAMYVGSPDYHLFEDAGQEKAFVLAEFPTMNADYRHPPTLTRIDSKARRLHAFSSVWENGEFSIRRVAPMEGAMVQVTVHAHGTKPSSADLAELRRKFEQAGASFVKIDVETEAVERQRVPVRAEDAPEAALAAWIEAQEDVPMEPTLTVGKKLIAAAMSDAT